jgi:Na+/H+ antiporter NhaD/arsenite permease-like protein
MQSLLYSRKFWLTVFGVVQALVFSFVPGVPEEVWQAIAALVMVLIASIAVEDGAEKLNRSE